MPVGMMVVGALGAVLVASLAWHGPRPKPAPIRTSAGGIVCGGCGGTGTLTVSTTSSSEDSASNVVLYCARCGSSDWHPL